MFTRILRQKGLGSIRKYEKNPTDLKIAKSVERFRVTFRANGKRQTANVRFKLKTFQIGNEQIKTAQNVSDG